jgi:hypothetical protein
MEGQIGLTFGFGKAAQTLSPPFERQFGLVDRDGERVLHHLRVSFYDREIAPRVA